VKGRVLIVAGSDSGGGAGVQADIRTVTALGGYAATAITALTAQNTLGVIEVLPVPARFVASQMRAVLDDIGADCIKTGMLGDTGVIDAVCAVLAERAGGIPVVTDPVLSAHEGTLLLDSGALPHLMGRLLPRVTLLTPNVPEAVALTGMRIEGREAMLEAARRLASLGPAAVLVKGGHLPGTVVYDVLVHPGGEEVYEHLRLGGRALHGTGCTLASAIATGLAQGRDLPDAVRRARAYVLEAIRRAPGYGAGVSPLGLGR
jgi:hydroxymethylpyrimidine/phosphomethylpyrimidine kinase